MFALESVAFSACGHVTRWVRLVLRYPAAWLEPLPREAKYPLWAHLISYNNFWVKGSCKTLRKLLSLRPLLQAGSAVVIEQGETKRGDSNIPPVY